MRTLYLTDLDGTLLQPDATLSAFARDGLNVLAGRGVFVGAATARTAATVGQILAGASFLSPAILMNGVCLYHLLEKRYLRIEPLPREGLDALLDAIHALGLAGYLYTVDERLHTYYEREGSENSRTFRRERQTRYGKVFERVSDFRACAAGAVYYSVTDRESALLPAQETLSRIPGLRTAFYRDVYHEGCWYLEVSAACASKKRAAEWLREYGAWDRLVGFGDNFNDLPLFEACDAAFAVQNAAEACRNAAKGVIGANTEDGVVRWLLENA